MDMSVLFEKLIVFAGLIVVGYICAKRGIVDQKSNKVLSALVVNAFLPATLFNSVLSGNVELSGRDIIMAMVMMSVAIIICYCVGFAASRLLPMEDDMRVPFALTAALPNTMYFALPVVSALLGPVAVIYLGLSNLPFNTILFTYGVYRLTGGKGNGLKLKNLISAPMVATFLSILLFIINPPIPKTAISFVSTMSAATMPLSMVVIGVTLSSAKLSAIFTDKELYAVAFCRLIAAPLLVYLFCMLFRIDGMIKAVMVIMASVPTAAVTASLAMQYDRKPVFISQGVSLTTLLSLITMPLLIWILF